MTMREKRRTRSLDGFPFRWTIPAPSQLVLYSNKARWETGTISSDSDTHDRASINTETRKFMAHQPHAGDIVNLRINVCEVVKIPREFESRILGEWQTNRSWTDFVVFTSFPILRCTIFPDIFYFCNVKLRVAIFLYIPMNRRKSRK